MPGDEGGASSVGTPKGPLIGPRRREIPRRLAGVTRVVIRVIQMVDRRHALAFISVKIDTWAQRLP